MINSEVPLSSPSSSTSTSNLSLSHHHHHRNHLLMMMESSSSSSSSMKPPALLIKWRRSKRKRSTKIFKSWQPPALMQARIPLTKQELDHDDDFGDRPLPELQERKTDKLFPGSTLPRIITRELYNTG